MVENALCQAGLLLHSAALIFNLSRATRSRPRDALDARPPSPCKPWPQRALTAIRWYKQPLLPRPSFRSEAPGPLKAVWLINYGAVWLLKGAAPLLHEAEASRQ